MLNKEFILQRICVYVGEDFDPNCDEQVSRTLVNKFNISLPQRRTLDEALQATASEHEIIDLILDYRASK